MYGVYRFIINKGVQKFFTEVRREEDKKRVMLGDKNNNQGLVDGSALVSRGVPVNRSNGEQRKRLWCDHCNRIGHLVTLAGKFTES